jgi:hypothetical protein
MYIVEHTPQANHPFPTEPGFHIVAKGEQDTAQLQEALMLSALGARAIKDEAHIATREGVTNFNLAVSQGYIPAERPDLTGLVASPALYRRNLLLRSIAITEGAQQQPGIEQYASDMTTISQALQTEPVAVSHDGVIGTIRRDGAVEAHCETATSDVLAEYQQDTAVYDAVQEHNRKQPDTPINAQAEAVLLGTNRSGRIQLIPGRLGGYYRYDVLGHYDPATGRLANAIVASSLTAENLGLDDIHQPSQPIIYQA